MMTLSWPESAGLERRRCSRYPVRVSCFLRSGAIPPASWNISRLARLMAASQGGGLHSLKASAPLAGSSLSLISNLECWALLHQPSR